MLFIPVCSLVAGILDFEIIFMWSVQGRTMGIQAVERDISIVRFIYYTRENDPSRVFSMNWSVEACSWYFVWEVVLYEEVLIRGSDINGD